MSYESEVHGGIKWISISIVLTRVTRVLTTLLLARLLAPEMFGLVGMAHATLEILRTIREMGFGSAYIQRQDQDPDRQLLAANTTFWLGVVVNFALFAIAFGLTPHIAAFFRSSAVEPVLRVMFVTFLLDALSSVPALDLQKKLDFRRLAICEVITSVVYAVVAIAMAVLGAGVWSLVVGTLISSAVYALSLYQVSTWRPKLEFDLRIARELFDYGKYIWAFVLLSGIGEAMDKLIVGRYYGETHLGIYTIAFVLCTFPSKYITSMVNRLTFPLFSKLQSDVKVLKDAVMKSVSHVSILSFPMAIGLLAVAPELVDVLLGSKWTGVLPLINVLAFYGLVLSIAAVTGPAFKAMGKPNVLFYTSVVHHSIKITLLFVFRDQGLIGICYAVFIPILISSLIAFVCIRKLLNCSIAELAIPILRPAVAAALMFIAVRYLGDAVQSGAGLAPILELSLFISAGVIVYIAMSLITNRAVMIEFSNSIVKILHGHRRAA